MSDAQEPTTGSAAGPAPDSGSDSDAPLRHAWSEVGEQFSSLGSLVASRVRKDRADDTPAGAAAPTDSADAGASATEDAADQARRDAELRAALDRFLAAGRDLGDRLVGVGRDEEVRGQLRQATRSLDDALTATVDVVTNRVTGLVRRGDAGTSDDTPTGASGHTTSSSGSASGSASGDGTPEDPATGRIAGDA